jgi:hypothetical protein
VNYLCGAFGLSSVGSGRSRAFGSWSKYFAGISDSRGSGVSGGEGSYENRGENGGESNRTIITIIFRLSLRCFSSYSITRSFLAISA